MPPPDLKAFEEGLTGTSTAVAPDLADFENSLTAQAAPKPAPDTFWRERYAAEAPKYRAKTGNDPNTADLSPTGDEGYLLTLRQHARDEAQREQDTAEAETPEAQADVAERAKANRAATPDPNAPLWRGVGPVEHALKTAREYATSPIAAGLQAEGQLERGVLGGLGALGWNQEALQAENERIKRQISYAQAMTGNNPVLQEIQSNVAGVAPWLAGVAPGAVGIGGNRAMDMLHEKMDRGEDLTPGDRLLAGLAGVGEALPAVAAPMVARAALAPLARVLHPVLLAAAEGGAMGVGFEAGRPQDEQNVGGSAAAMAAFGGVPALWRAARAPAAPPGWTGEGRSSQEALAQLMQSLRGGQRETPSQVPIAPDLGAPP